MKILIFVIGVAWAAVTQEGSPLWPKDIKLDSKQKMTLFQPQVTSLTDNKVTARTAFKIVEDGKDVYGSFLMTANTFISKDAGIVTIKDIKVSDIQLPQGKTDVKKLAAEFQEKLGGQSLEVPYESLVNNRDMQVSGSKKPDLKNTPPKFIFTKRPSILIMISGDPVWTPQKGASEVEKVANTSALILHEKGKDYYIWALNKWFSAKQLLGEYSPRKDVSSKFVMIKDDLVKNKKVDPLEGKSADGKEMFAPGESPMIILSTVPAELLQSSGEPQYQAVEGTGLLYMSNSPNSIFLDSKTQEYFVLVTGRWFTTKNLESPWAYVDGKSLPSDFKKIPVTSPVAEVLVSIPGTPQAKEGVIVSSIPQMAQVKKDLKPKNIECDGKAQWQKISGLSISYATNCNTPIVQVTTEQYYAVQDGVWFFSNNQKDWSVAAVIPTVIYDIPTSCPIYYVTYVRIYNVGADYVTVGYTPGYHGTFVSADGTVVYGTGYAYSSYASGTQWYPAPATYGYGAGYGYDSGFYMGFTMGAFMYPWGWGGCCYGGVYMNIDVTNVYHNWGRHTVVSGPGGGGFTVNAGKGGTNFYRANSSNQIYATRDGQVYRRDGKGDWSRQAGPGAWTPVEKGNVSGLENLHQDRVSSDRQFNGNQSRGMSHENRGGALHGGGAMRASGGFRGGGGFRR